MSRLCHQVIDGNLYCTVEVWDAEKGQWIGKQDVGTMSYSEKEKGQASDSFKRACFNWGLGRELYTAPFIWVPAERTDILVKTKDREKKYYTNERFHVQSISYDGERAIDFVSIANSQNQTVYSMNLRRNGSAEQRSSEIKSVETAVTREQMTPDVYGKAMRSLGNSKDKTVA